MLSGRVATRHFKTGCTALRRPGPTPFSSSLLVPLSTLLLFFLPIGLRPDEHSDDLMPTTVPMARPCILLEYNLQTHWSL
jgi:hypothetical protein